MYFIHMTQGCIVAVGLAATLLAGCESETATPSATPAVETMAEFTGAPTAVVGGAWACAGKAQGTVTGGAVELNGYVRLLSDPEAKQPVPAAKIEAFSAAGVSLSEPSYADPSKAGRVALSVPVKSTGFDGYAVISQAGFLDFRLQSSRKVVSTDLAGWAWLATQAEVDSRAQAIGIPLEAGKGILVGSVHDCDGFGAANAVVEVGGSLSTTVLYAEGFDLVAKRVFTADSGRFAVANLPAGPVTIKAFGRAKAGGKLQLLSKIETTIVAGKMTAVDLAPRAAGQ